MELELSLNLLLLLSGAVLSGLCAQLSLSAAFNDFRDGATVDLAPLLDLGFSGNLNSAQYLSVGTDILLDLLLVLSAVVLPSNGLSTSLLAVEFAVSAICWGGEFIFSGISSSSLVSCSSCLLVRGLTSAGSSSLPSGSSLTSVSDLFGSGGFSGSGSGIRFTANPLTSSSSAGDSRSISSSSSSSTWKWFWNNCSGLLLLDRAEPGDCINDWKRPSSLFSELAAILELEKF